MGKGRGPLKEPSADDRYWFDRLDAAHARNHDLSTQRQAMAYFRKKKLPPDLLLKSEAGGSGEAMWIPKSMWGNILKVLEKWIGRDQVVLFFLQHLADPNWPGHGFAFEALLRQGKRILPLLEAEIEHNKGDRGMVEELEYLREELTAPS
ncbi:MAG: hypothetical protein IIC64_07065 [SAR324 cluster bacterium]|nr:hypothetical protein [SAR324 cluster bacterium]